MLDWLKWYLSVPLKALANAIFWIGAVRARVRAQLVRLDLQTVVTGVTIATAVAWLAIFVIADDADRERLSDAVRSLMATGE